MLWVLYALVAAVFAAIGNIFTKKVLVHEHAIEYSALQGIISIAVMLVALFFVPLNYNWRIYASLYVISIAFSTGSIFYLRSVRHSELSSSMPMMNISPMFLVFIAYLFLGEEIGLVNLLGVLLLICGTYLLQTGVGGHGLLAPIKALIRSKYSLMMIFAMLVFSFTATMEKAIINQGVDLFTALVLLRLMISFNYVALETLEHGFKEVLRDLSKDGKMTVFAVLSNLFQSVFYYLALAVPGALVSLIIPVKRTSTMLSTLFGGRLFHEHRLGQKMLACAVMIIGVLLIAL